jgi:hypothetical protein
LRAPPTRRHADEILTELGYRAFRSPRAAETVI